MNASTTTYPVTVIAHKARHGWLVGMGAFYPNLSMASMKYRGVIVNRAGAGG